MAKEKQLGLDEMDQVSGGSTRVNDSGGIDVLKNGEVIGTFSKDQARQALDFYDAANGPHSRDFGHHHRGGFFGQHWGHKH